MRKTFFSLIAILLSLGSLSAREVLPLGEGWYFSPTRETGRMGSFGWGTPAAGPVGEAVTLPHTWNAEDFMSDEGYRRGFGTYTKSLDIPQSYAGKRVFVKFEAAGSMATVIVNNRIVGEHKGPYNAFTFEITDFITPGGENSISVICDNGPHFDIAPQGGDFNIYGGLYRDAWLEVTEDQCISPLYFASSGVLVHQTLVNEKRAELSAEVHLSTLSDYSGCEVAFSLEDAEGRVVAQKRSTIVSSARATCFVGLDNPHLWNGKDDPYLYKAVTVLRKDGVEIDRVEENVGLRYFWIDSDKGFFLNGRHLKLRGVCRHQDWAGVASALTEENHLADYDFFDEIGANALRLAHYPQAKFMFSEADRRGYVVWEEIPFVGSYVPTQAFDDHLRLQLCEMIVQNYNHPSICFWGLFNEIVADIDGIVADLNDIAHDLDPTRLTTCAVHMERDYVNTSDLVSWNKYFGWYYDTSADLGPFMDDWHSRFPDSRLGISEYGGGASVRQHADRYRAEDEVNVRNFSFGGYHPEEKQFFIHHESWKAISERDFVWGSFVWNMFDFASSMRNEGDTRNQNDKGLVTHDRKTRKDAFYFYRANWNDALKTVHLCSKHYTERESDTTDIVAVSTSPSVKLYLNGKLVGTQKTDAFRTVVWQDVHLSKGENTVVIKTADGEDSAVWNVK